MRFELYSFAELFGSYRYRFRTESDNAEDLLLYMVTISVEDDGWVLLDNRGERCHFSALGFATEPNEQEWLKRVLYCKLSRELHKKGNTQDVWDALGFEDSEKECVRRVEEESGNLFRKLLRQKERASPFW